MGACSVLAGEFPSKYRLNARRYASKDAGRSCRSLSQEEQVAKRGISQASSLLELSKVRATPNIVVVCECWPFFFGKTHGSHDCDILHRAEYPFGELYRLF